MSHFKTTLHTWFTIKYIPKNQSVHIQKYRHVSHSSQLDFCHKFSFIQKKATVVLFFSSKEALLITILNSTYNDWLVFFSIFFSPLPYYSTTGINSDWLAQFCVWMENAKQYYRNTNALSAGFAAVVQQIQANALAQLGSNPFKPHLRATTDPTTPSEVQKMGLFQQEKPLHFPSLSPNTRDRVISQQTDQDPQASSCSSFPFNQSLGLGLWFQSVWSTIPGICSPNTFKISWQVSTTKVHSSAPNGQRASRGLC